ncbi:transglutaminase domain-containing protein [candidate division KSB1 bacterium]
MNRDVLMIRFGLVFAFALLTSIGAVSAEVKEHTEVIESSDHSFTIDVGGTIDPENLEIKIENDGPVPVVNPRVTVNGKYNWYTLKDLVAEITTDCATDKEKAMAIYDFVERETYWWSFPKDDTRMNPVRHFNVYGYHICSDAASEFVGLCEAAGIDARVWEIGHHTVAEGFWDGAWHHMDADIGIWYLKADNKTIASIEELGQHPEWVAKTYKPYRWFLTPGDNRKIIYKPEADPAGKGLAILYETMDNNFAGTHYDKWIFQEQNMNLTLRQGEKMIRWWKPVLRKHYDQKSIHEPPRYANGRIVFKPDFSKYTYDGLVSRRNLKYQVEDGVLPVVHVDKLQDPDYYDYPSRLTIPMNSPYVIVGGHVDTKFYKGGTTGLDRVGLSADLDPVFHQSTSLWNYYSWAYAAGECRAILDEKLSRDGEASSYSIRLTYNISANVAHKDMKPEYPLIYGGQSGLDYIKIAADIQVNPASLPALSLGENIIKYVDSTDSPHHLKITYKWREIDDQHTPEAPKSAKSPKTGSRVRGLAPKLEWTAAKDADGDRIVNYRVQVSLRSDCAWPLVSSLDRDVRDGAAFQVPEGWLNPQTTYYWRVRAEDEKGNFGPWSDIWSFSTR